MNIVIDRTEAIALLRKAVDAKGEGHVVDSCVYVERDEAEFSAGCIVGTALVEKIGLDETVKIMTAPLVRSDDEGDTRPPNDLSLTVIREHLAAYGVTLTDDAHDAWRRAQSVQDGGEPWYRALDEATTLGF